MNPIKRLRTFPGVLAAALLASCGTPGAPQPPSLQLPRPADDLAITRKGDRVVLRWTTPRETTDGTTIKQPGATRICRAVGQPLMDQCAQVVGELPAGQAPLSAPAVFTDVLPRELQRQNAGELASYAVETLSARGRSAGLSNQVRVPLAPTLPPPADFRAQVTPEGPLLTFTADLHEHEVEGLRHRFRIYRRVEGTQADTVIGEVALRAEPRAEVRDLSFEWEKSYLYRITAVTVVPHEGAKLEVEGEDSEPVRLLVHDSFAPATPAGLQAVFSGRPQEPFIDLTWAPNTEADLAGYNVYRREEGGTAAKINTEVVRAPAFKDDKVQPGRRYFYTVSALDLRGNESGRSEEASEAVPASQ